ncbi:glycoside hydrolase [Halorhodospira abdelmalekii]|uniref:glycoside hydrolase family 57 protein n=1 Tax=Halorhodospira abdelmalekii TaxID=421629 RepID=UPI001906FF0F|nr:glycoside hydrolase family 57 protein [Halorhodospira abdelmalekii]MBK1734163.1 glycoside hydrolase [Halorhodospira abdelmalekii]
MHQPHYANPTTGDYELPWAYLHGIKDYTDMVAHLEAHPEARAVVNFSPVLIEQIEDYAEQISAFLADGRPLRDPLLRALALPTLASTEEARQQLLEQCRRINRPRLVDPFPAYQQLMALSDLFVQQPESVRYLNDRFFADFVTWYHLGWLGETVRSRDPRAQRLIEKGSDFTLHERRELLSLIGEELAAVLGRYRALAEAGRIELSMTPYAHPILPLLIDLQSAREAWPEVVMPEAIERYPGGEERARWHLSYGLECFERAFGQRPSGCWPSEGALSEPTLKLLAEYGFRWAASGGAVLDHSLNATAVPAEARNGNLHRAYIVAPAAESLAESSAPSSTAEAAALRCFFRDDGLSDAIGFTYSDWHGDDAVANLISHLEEIAAVSSEPHEAVISIIMDGENAWEHYPANGYYFLDGLYRRLSEHPRLQLSTFAEASAAVTPRRLERLVAGSWVYGTLSTWIGEIDKNRGWELLGEAKACFDAHIDQLGGEERARAEQQLAICESSDWFWWFGDYNPEEVVRDFDFLYRVQLTALYQMLGVEPPEHLSAPFAHRGTGDPALGGVMRQGRPESGGGDSGGAG